MLGMWGPLLVIGRVEAPPEHELFIVPEMSLRVG